MSAELETIRLGPLGGLSGMRVADEGVLDTQRPLPMRGGYNVEVRDGEWWVRPGYDFTAGSRIIYGSIPWWWVVVTPGQDLLVSPYHALIFAPSSGEVTEVYTPAAAAESITFTAGVNTATASTARSAGELILVGAAGGTTVVYLIIAVSGGGSTAITLDRLYEAGHPVGAQTCRVLASFDGNPLNDSQFSGEDPARDAAGYALIDQLVTHAADALYVGQPAVTAGEQYMIVTRRGSEPIAFRTDGGSAILRNWFRDTSTAAPAEIGNGLLCAGHMNRVLIMSADPTGAYDRQTLWHSMPGDFLLYHTGVAGQTGVPHFKTFQMDDGLDTFQAIVPLGEAVVLHRRLSQEVGYPQGSALAPYQWRRYSVGTGLTSTRAIAAANGVHYLVTDLGLSVFDGQSLQPIIPEAEEHLRAQRGWNKVRVLIAVEDEQRLYGVTEEQTRHQAAAIPATANVTIASGSSSEAWQSTEPVWVYDYKNGQLWMEDHVAPVGLQGRLGGATSTSGQAYFWARFDGTILNMGLNLLGAYTGFDRGVTTGTHVVDALVDTPWMGFDRRRRIHSLELGLRALDLTTGGVVQSITDLWSLSTETLHLCTVEVYLDGDMTTPYVSQDVTKVVSEMLALTADENQQLPLMPLDCVHLDAAATSIKLRFKNALSSASTTAGYTKGMFRIAYIDLRLIPTETYRANDPDPAP